MAAARKLIEIRDVQGMEPESMLWDSVVPGFHVRRQKSSAISYYVFYRTVDGRQRFQVIGRHRAPWNPDTARDEARRILGVVASGADPAADKEAKRIAASVSELCDLYVADAEAGRLLTKGGSQNTRAPSVAIAAASTGT